jgi:hypothetical protein
MVHLDMTAVGDTSGEEMITDVIANVPELRQPGTTARIIGDNYNPVAAAVMDPALGSQEEWSGRLNARLGTHGIAAEIITEPADAITAGKDVFLDTHAGTITVYGGNRRQLLHEVITTPESPKRAGQLAPTERPAAEASDDVPRLSMRAVAGTVVSGNTDRLRDQAAQALSVYEAHVAATVARGGEIDHMHFWDSVLPRGENGLNVLSQLIIDAQPALTEVGEQGVQQLVVGRLGSALRDLGQRLARIPEASTSRRSVREAILARQALLRQIHDRIINEQRTTD